MNAGFQPPKAYAHQAFSTQFIIDNKRVFNTSDAGTGKTRSVLDAVSHLRKQGMGRVLVMGTLSILQPAWGGDIRKWTPWLSYGLSTAGSEKSRKAAFESDCDIVVTNHDAAVWLTKNIHLLDGFDMIVIDESTAFKHRTSQRSKAIGKIVKLFDRRILMTATPINTTVCDIWYQAFILDDGERLGRMFSGFRMQACEPVQVGPTAQMVKWVDKAGVEDVVAERMRDITVRFKFEDCIDVPENVTHMLHIQLPPALMKHYQTLQATSILETQRGELINAIHAGSRAQKLLQLCSGAVYDEERVTQRFSSARHELVMQLVMEREHSVVAFNWRHQREELEELAKKYEVSYAVIDGSTPTKDRFKIVEDYQAGKYRVIFAHPQAAGHGLTLTRGHATIWTSPTSNAEWFKQFNARIYRAGQDHKTETILIAAEGTREDRVYELLNSNSARMDNLLSIFTDTTGDKR